MKANILRSLLALCLLATAKAPAAVLYVDVNSASPTPPFTSWSTAATNIQDAVDAAVGGDQLVVTNGVYAKGGLPSTRVWVEKPILLQSVNGPAVTQIVGASWSSTGGFYRCVYLADGAFLSGFTLTNGLAYTPYGDILSGSGGGVLAQSSAAIVSNCVFAANEAWLEGGGAYNAKLINCTLSGNRADYGGGAFGGILLNCALANNEASAGGGAASNTLDNCTLVQNHAWVDGGGAYFATLNNCTLSGNSADHGGGGVRGGRLNNCIVYYNAAPNATPPGVVDNWVGATLINCCTAPGSGATRLTGNFAREPLFVNTNQWADLQLQSNSPCINAGRNAYAPPGTDLDGNPRISGATVDIGAYEFQSPASVLSYAWAQQYGLATDGSADYADPDGDGMNNWREWLTGTVPTNSLSALVLLGPTNGPLGVVVTWQSEFANRYFLERATNLGAGSVFSLLSTNLLGFFGTTSFTDTNATGLGPFFYRVGVQQ